jgi:NAD(P)-dependent dehydrogenase (short-subunit alcohol dehydrogenase family)
MLFKDKIVVVTGGGRGLGRDISLAFAREGAKVVLIGRTIGPLNETEEAIVALGSEALAIAADMADPDSVQSCAEQVLEHFGQVDVLINNAGVGGPSAPLWETELAEWQETLDINTTGPFLCCRAFLPSMITRKSGSIIFIGSMTGKRQLLNRTPYAASKIAIVGLARTLAWETGPYGIRVNVISPGPMEGERMNWVLETQAKDQGLSVEEVRQRLSTSSPLDQFVPTEDVAAMSIFLASDMAGSTTGEDINVSAGICMY